MARKRYLVLGEGAAGMTAAEVLRRYDAEAAVTIVSDDPNPAYFRAALTNYLLGELRDEQIWAVPPTFYNDFRIERLLARVTAVDARKHQVWLSSGGPPMVYDALFIGTGARARQPAFEGADLQGVGTLRTLQDVRWVMDQLAYGAVRHAVVIGGGPLALEWAHALRERGAAVTMLVRETRFLPGALDAVGSDLLLARIRRGGIDVRLGDEVVRAMPDAAMRLGGVQLRSGQALQCDLCAAGIGVVCNTEALQNSGITLGPLGGVVVDDRMRTSVPGAFAAGDVAEFDGKLDQKWEPARLQALVAASNMAGADQRYTPGAQYFATRLYDLDFASIGRIDVPAPGPGVPPTEEIAVAPRGGGRVSYRKLFVQQGRLVGALLLGERDERVRQRGRQYKRLVDGKVDIASVRGDLLDPAFDLPAWLATRSLTHKPQPTRAFAMPPEGMPKMPKNAQMRGTMALDVRDLRVPMAAAVTGFVAPIAGARGAPGPGGPPYGAGVVSPQAASVAAGGVGAGLAGVPVIDRAVDPMLSIGLRAPHAPLAPAAGGPQAWLEGAGQRWDLAPETVSIGRGPQNHVVLTDPAVSHRHAQVSRIGPHLYLRDVGSRAGTFVNGRQVTVPHGLSHGDRVRLGSTELGFACPTGPAPAGAYANEPSLPGVPPGSHAPPTPGAWPGAGHAAPGAPNIGPSGYAQAPIPNAWGAPGQPPPPYSATPGSAGAPGARRACLEVRAGPILGVGFALSGASVTIGRDPQSAVRLDDMSVSRRHAVLAAHDGHWFVSDLSSARGTWKNGERLPPGQEFPLREGDRIQVGETVLELVSRPA